MTDVTLNLGEHRDVMVDAELISYVTFAVVKIWGLLNERGLVNHSSEIAFMRVYNQTEDEINILPLIKFELYD